MFIDIDASSNLGKRKPLEKWQNSTLRYSPPADFPEYLSGKIGRAGIMRCWITLDEYWDYKTDTFYPDYDIGVKRYPDSELYYPYDWKSIVPAPSGTKFVGYLTSHAKCADEVMLNVRRLEREVSDGIITFDKFEEVLYTAIDYCKTLAPNIKYIECCNEVQLKSFGNLSGEEYYNIYKVYYKVIRRLNREHDYDVPLLLGGYAKADMLRSYERWDDFLSRYSQDSDSDKMLDFYSFHFYHGHVTEGLLKNNTNPAAFSLTPKERLQFILYLHDQTLRRLSLPTLPIFLDEFGFTATTGVLTDSLKNASGDIYMMISTSDIPELHLFPWCTFHNPKLQISFTQYLLLDDRSYVPTPNGCAMQMIHSLKDDLLNIRSDKTDYCIATAGDGVITAVCTNPTDIQDVFNVTVENLGVGSYKVEEYLCDSYRNNYVTGEKSKDLHKTAEYTLATDSNGRISFKAYAEPYAFCFWKISKES